MGTDISHYGGSTSGAFGQGNVASTGDVTGTASTNTDAELLTSSWEKSSLTQSEAKAATPGYTSNSSNPTLPPGTQTDPSAAQATLQHLFDFPKLMNNLVSSGLNPMPASSSEEDEEVTDPEVIALAESEGQSPGAVLSSVQAQASSNFQALLSQLSPALLAQYPNAAKQLLFAFNNPGQTASLPPALQTQLQTMTQTSNAQTAQQFGFSPGWKGVPPDTDDYNQTILNQYDIDFQTNLQSAAVANNLSESDVALLQSIHYLPDSASTTDPNLLNTLNSAQTAAAATVQQQYGLPSSFALTPNSAQYTQTLTGAYQQALMTAMQQQQPPLTADQQDQVEQYLEDPEAAVDPDIAALAQSLKASATASVISQYGLNSNWQPAVSTLNTQGTDPAMGSLVQSGLSTIKEVMQNANNLVANMPAGPSKNTYLNFLKVIGIALNNAQNEILAIQGAQSDVARKLSLVQLQTQLSNLSQQESSIDEANKKQGKMANTGPMTNIMNWVFKAVMLIAAVALCFVNPVLGAMALVATVFSIVDSAVAQATGKPSLTDQMFAAVTKALGPAAGAAVNLVLSAVMSGGNPLLFMQLTFSDANVIGGFVQACGGSKEQQMIASAVIQGIIMIAATIVLCVVTMGAGAGAVAASVLETVADITEASANTIVKGVQVTMDVVQTALSCVQVAGQACEINNDLLMSQIDLLQGRANAENEQIQGIVEMLKMLISKLLDMLQSGSNTIVNIQNLQSKKYSDASDINTQITSAIPT